MRAPLRRSAAALDLLAVLVPPLAQAQGGTSTCMNGPADFICMDQSECDGQNTCCYLTGVCANSQASNCVDGDPINDPRFPPPGGPDIVNQGANDPDGCICVGADAAYPNPNPTCDGADPPQGCWGTLRCDGMGTCAETGYCQSGNFGSTLGVLCIQNGVAGTFKYCGTQGFVPPTTQPSGAPSATPSAAPAPAPTRSPATSTGAPMETPTSAGGTTAPTASAAPTQSPTPSTPTQRPTPSTPTQRPTVGPTSPPTLAPDQLFEPCPDVALAPGSLVPAQLSGTKTAAAAAGTVKISQTVYFKSSLVQARQGVLLLTLQSNLTVVGIKTSPDYDETGERPKKYCRRAMKRSPQTTLPSCGTVSVAGQRLVYWSLGPVTTKRATIAVYVRPTAGRPVAVGEVEAYYEIVDGWDAGSGTVDWGLPVVRCRTHAVSPPGA